jgi:hypothetical protein
MVIGNKLPVKINQNHNISISSITAIFGFAWPLLLFEID